MEIVFVASEMKPFAQTGGLADVIGALPESMAELGYSVSVFLPEYKAVADQNIPFETVVDSINIPVGSDVETGKIRAGRHGQVNVFLIGQPDFFHREGLYGTPLGDYPDNDARFVFFQRAVLETLKKIKLRPDIIHCHDWQSGLIPAYLKTLYRGDPFFKETKTIFTIHNMAYQGNFPPDSISTTGLSWSEFRFDRLEFFGKISFLKAGIAYADVLTTVSKRYVQEIQTKEFGCGMEGILNFRKKDLHGILNGIDTEEWDPSRDPALPVRFDAETIDKRAVCKAMLQKESRLNVDPDVPLFGFIGRLATQKGPELLEAVVDRMVEKGWQLVLLGTGSTKHQETLREAAKRHPGRVSANILFDVRMSKRIYAGADIFLMMSEYEPCGLGQLYAFRYGAVPVVHEAGGLFDTVHDYDPATGKGNGFVFQDYDPEAFYRAMERAASVFRDRKKWLNLVRAGMKSDFSWNRSAQAYAELYRSAERKPLGV